MIVKFAQDKEADLIVVGTKGTHSDKDGILLGNVSHRVASMPNVPCWWSDPQIPSFTPDFQ